MNVDPIARLTDNQRAYLRMVLAHHSSKEIALNFGISAHTVDKRIKEAMRLLGVTTRIEAARLLSLAEQPPGLRQLGSQSPDLASHPNMVPPEPATIEGMHSGTFATQDMGRLAGIQLRDGDVLPLPLPLFSRPRHGLTIWQRAGWMIGLIIGLAFATGILLSGLMAISALLNAGRG